MSKLKTKFSVETAFGTYVLDEIIGQGGAGTVYGGQGPDVDPVAVKILREDQATAEKRRRFKNEISFLLRVKHLNIVPVLDYGVVRDGKIEGPFYVMPRFDGSLRTLMNTGLSPDQVLPLFAQILDGVEAAHLLTVAHRDIKPENILFEAKTKKLAVADFGIASITGELAATVVETTHHQRLANFQYCAPEQRTPGRAVGKAADLYALGLILNEMFTGEVPHGLAHKSIGSVAPAFEYLDLAVSTLLNQSPSARPASIAILKGELSRLGADALAAQRIGAIDGTVVRTDEVDNPLAKEPPQLVNFDWDGGKLTLFLDRSVTPEWIDVIRNHLGGHSAVWGRGPEVFHYNENKAIVAASAHEVQPIIDHFKVWLPRATQVLAQRLEQAASEKARAEKRRLKEARALEEQRRQLMKNVRL